MAHATPAPVEPALRLRHRVLHLLKEEEAAPDLAFGVLLSIFGTIAAAGKVGRWRMLWRCWRAYGGERRRIVAGKVKELIER